MLSVLLSNGTLLLQGLNRFGYPNLNIEHESHIKGYPNLNIESTLPVPGKAFTSSPHQKVWEALH